MFGIPGGRNSVDLIQAGAEQGVEFVLMRTEAAAAIMAATTAEGTVSQFTDGGGSHLTDKCGAPVGGRGRVAAPVACTSAPKPTRRNTPARSARRRSRRDLRAVLDSRACASMKIATFNINNIVRRLPNLLDWLRGAEPDVVCLQELKTTDGSFPQAALADAGYGAVWRGQRSWNGVAILARGRKPILVRDELPGDAADRQSRYLEAAVGGVLVACIYLPNGNP